MIKPTTELVNEITKGLVDKGMLIEAGWVGLSIAAIPATAPPEQLEMMREAFFAGAAHLWSSINSVLEAGEEPTANDLMRMDQINNELSGFMKDYERRHKLP